MENKKVNIEVSIKTNLYELARLFNEDGTDEEFEEWVENDLDILNVVRLIDARHVYGDSENQRVSYVDIEGSDNE